MRHPLCELPESFHQGKPMGITSVCSAHPIVIEAALRLAKENGSPVLIEATCNQVNQDGGYTGMTPIEFREFVAGLVEKVDIDPNQVILGGDHLGPNPWKHLLAAEAMAKAEVMIAAFASAGFTKLHLDTSMGCSGEPAALPDHLTAERAAQLAAVAEANGNGRFSPVYIIGTEVPTPGGALEELDHVEVTSPAAVSETYRVHKEAFEARGLHDAFARVIGLVVQPGVEFGHSDVIHFDAAKAHDLSAFLKTMPGLVFEAHSTDYQAPEALRELAQNGFGILKVGPWLTFAMREALYALDNLADVLECQPPRGALMATMERVMMDEPDNWVNYYSGDKAGLWLQRHFSYSDRIRYYWPTKKAQIAVSQLRQRLDGRNASLPLFSQFLPHISESRVNLSMDEILISSVQFILRKYELAISN